MNELDLQVLKEALEILCWHTGENAENAIAALDKVIEQEQK